MRRATRNPKEINGGKSGDRHRRRLGRMGWGGMKSAPEEQLALHIKATGLPAPVREFYFAKPRRFRADFAWPDRKILAEVEGGTWSGGRHVRGKGYESDCEKYSIAAMLGYRVLRFTTAMVRDGRAIGFLTATIKGGGK
jgi:very-short-patch-repair endonuclease